MATINGDSKSIVIVAGDRGPRGPIGMKGDSGSKGDRGDKGEKGDKGDKGEPGIDGNDAFVVQSTILGALGLSLTGNAGKVLAVKADGSGFELVAAAGGGTVPTNPPVFSAAPVITGTATEGQTLSATTGTASNSPTYALQWKRNGSAISGATGSTYVLVTADVGTTITVTSTATNGGGSDTSTSTPTATVAAAPVAPPNARSASTITRTSGPTTYPPTVSFTRPIDWADGDKAIMQWSADVTFGSGVSETPTPVTLAAATTTYDFGLSAITSGSRFIRMAVWSGSRPGTLTFSNIINVGDVIAPTLNSGTTSSAENGPMAVPVMADEPGIGTLRGSSASLLEFVQLSPTTGTVRLPGNANLNFETQTAYNWFVDWADYAGNVGTGTFTHNVTNQVENPSGMAFTAVTGATTSTLYTSNTYTVAGLPTGYAAPVSFSGTGGYKKNGGTATTAAGTVVNGDTLAIALTSSASGSSTVSGTLTVGGEATPVSATYSVQTVVSLSTNTTWDDTQLGPFSTLSTDKKTLSHTVTGNNTENYISSGSRTSTAKSGVRYGEITLSGGTDGGAIIGFANGSFNAAGTGDLGTDNNSTALNSDGGFGYGPATGQTGSNAGFTVGDVIGLYHDTSNGLCRWYKNGTLMLSWTAVLGASVYIAIRTKKAMVATLNTGQTAFTYSPPAGAQAWDV